MQIQRRRIKQDFAGWKVIFPEKLKEGHEAHFARVTEKFLEYLKNGNMPAWEVPNMLAKYYTTTKGLELALKRSNKYETIAGSSKWITILCSCLLFAAQHVYSQVRLPQMVRDSMILQRDVKLKIWGWAAKNEKVTVKFNGKTYKTKADAKATGWFG